MTTQSNDKPPLESLLAWLRVQSETDANHEIDRAIFRRWRDALNDLMTRQPEAPK